jgi:hypothetical protein
MKQVELDLIKHIMLHCASKVRMYRYDADELETMASGIIAAIRKFAIPVNELTDQQVWEELQKSGYRFPIGAAKFGDINYSRIEQETEWWFEALNLAIRKLWDIK